MCIWIIRCHFSQLLRYGFFKLLLQNLKNFAVPPPPAPLTGTSPLPSSGVTEACVLKMISISLGCMTVLLSPPFSRLVFFFFLGLRKWKNKKAIVKNKDIQQYGTPMCLYLDKVSLQQLFGLFRIQKWTKVDQIKEKIVGRIHKVMKYGYNSEPDKKQWVIHQIRIESSIRRLSGSQSEFGILIRIQSFQTQVFFSSQIPVHKIWT